MLTLTYVFLLLSIIFSMAATEYCYYREGKENKDGYLDCELLNLEEPIESVSLIHLNHNTTIPVFKKGLISKFKNLKTLYITAANMQRIEPGALDDLKLIMIDFFHNNLKAIENGTFNNLTSLEFLDLSHNEFETLEVNTFIGLTSLEWLSVTSNRLKTINKASFSHMRKLKALYLQFNQITELEPSTFEKLNSLELLDLSYNSIKRIQFGMFADQRNLLTLLLQQNYLTSFPKSLFDNTTSLNILDISLNNIAQLKEDLFRNLKQLEMIKFSSRNIPEFNSTSLLEYTPNLREIHFYVLQLTKNDDFDCKELCTSSGIYCNCYSSLDSTIHDIY